MGIGRGEPGSAQAPAPGRAWRPGWSVVLSVVAVTAGVTVAALGAWGWAAAILLFSCAVDAVVVLVVRRLSRGDSAREADLPG